MLLRHPGSAALQYDTNKARGCCEGAGLGMWNGRVKGRLHPPWGWVNMGYIIMGTYGCGYILRFSPWHDRSLARGNLGCNTGQLQGMLSSEIGNARLQLTLPVVELGVNCLQTLREAKTAPGGGAGGPEHGLSGPAPCFGLFLALCHFGCACRPHKVCRLESPFRGGGGGVGKGALGPPPRAAPLGWQNAKP